MEVARPVGNELGALGAVGDEAGGKGRGGKVGGGGGGEGGGVVRIEVVVGLLREEVEKDLLRGRRRR